MRSTVANLWRKIHPEKVDQFDRLPDEIILSIFNLVGDAVALGRCCTVSKRFLSIVPEVDNVVCHVDSLTSDEEERELAEDPRHPIASFFRVLFNPLLSLAQLIIPSARLLPLLKEKEEEEEETVSLSSMKQILRNFRVMKRLGIKLPAEELRIEDGVLLKLKAEYGAEFERCVILSASSVRNASCSDDKDEDGADLESIHESFYSEEGLNQRVVWIINSLVAISTKHYLLQPLIAEHKTLETLVLTDADGQGFLSMDDEEPFTMSWSSERTGLPPLDVQLWYAPRLEMPNGMVLKGATLMAIKPSELPILESSWAEPEGNWVLSAFEGPYGAAARMLVKERTYCVDIHAF